MMMVMVVIVMLLLLMMIMVFALVVMMCTMLLSSRDLCFQQSLLLIEVQDRNVETLKGDEGSLLLLTEECFKQLVLMEKRRRWLLIIAFGVWT